MSRIYATVTQYSQAGLLERESYNGMTVPLYLKLHYNKRQQLVDLRLGSVNDEWNWNRGALIFYYGTNAVNYWNPFQDDADNNGNVRRQVNYVPLNDAISSHVIPQLQDYSYDDLNRIGSVAEQQMNSGGGWAASCSQTFAYDRYGNKRITAATGGVNGYNPTYNTANNRINGLSYDAAGNITYDALTGGTMAYDAENRLLTASSGGGASYAYDGEGKRVKRITGGQEWWYVYGIGGELLAEYLSSAPTTVKKEYGYRNGQMLVVWDADKSGDERLKWLMTDHLGSTRMEADKSGSLAAMRRHDFLPFGEELTSSIGAQRSGIGYEPPTSNVRQKFAGSERDNEIGLDFMQARYYGSVQGRFTSVDPFDPILGKQGADDTDAAERELRSYLRQPQHWNRYVYALNNPLKYVDPDGMDPITVNLNIIYDQNSNYTDEEKKRIRESYIAQAQKNFGKIDVKFNVTETTGSASSISNERKQAVVSGAKEGAINAFFTKASVGPSSETTHYSTGAIFVSTGAQGADPRDLTHGIIHAAGLAGGVNGYRGPTKLLGSYALGGLTDYGPGSAEYHTEAIQQYLEGRREPIYTYGYNSAKTGAPPTVTSTTTHTAKDMQVLKDGLQRYSGK